MTNKPLPKFYRLAPDLDKNEIFSEEYEHWTVSDLIEMLNEYDPNARVWIGDDSEVTDEGGLVILRPIEMVFGSDGEVIF